MGRRVIQPDEYQERWEIYVLDRQMATRTLRHGEVHAVHLSFVLVEMLPDTFMAISNFTTADYISTIIFFAYPRFVRTTWNSRRYVVCPEEDLNRFLRRAASRFIFRQAYWAVVLHGITILVRKIVRPLRLCLFIL